MGLIRFIRFQLLSSPSSVPPFRFRAPHLMTKIAAQQTAHAA